MLQDAQKVRPSSHGSPLAPRNTNKGDENDRSVRMGWEWDVPSWIRLGHVIIHLLRSRLARRRSVFDESGLSEAKGASEVIDRSDRYDNRQVQRMLRLYQLPASELACLTGPEYHNYD